ncbi:restriction endonuclease subunit S [Candidatus Thiodictyon syntrophicum]|jgi:hypothetical protein|uniref:Uncharacterized protein n=1 Tax=Candidatus Thiodictyon syntrophicum TaxID=1166950 RepID=A0A2K8U264_9GAMM|nr:hypothetical protein [Candidatus Thiodictyon syntrophicum]AUB79678.1 hypothetical protein THSYN_01035 [Candidatus Thiodictyon syntrophicum]
MALQETRFRAVEGRMRDAIGELEEYRSALITAAVTGKIDVRGWQAAGNCAAPEAVAMGFAALYPSYERRALNIDKRAGSR